MLCPKCGKEIPAGSDHCISCGEAAAKENTAAEAAAAKTDTISEADNNGHTKYEVKDGRVHVRLPISVVEKTKDKEVSEKEYTKKVNEYSTSFQRNFEPYKTISELITAMGEC